MGYDPNQPRHPAGTGDGGQWSGGSSSTSTTVAIRDDERWKPEGGLKGETPKHLGEAIRDEKFERGAAWDKDGNFVGAYTSNQPHTVRTPMAVTQAVADGGHMMHNHPHDSKQGTGGAGFSPGDVMNAVWLRLGSTTVESRLAGEPVTYRLGGMDKLTPSSSESGIMGDRIEAQLKKLVDDFDHQPEDTAYSRGVFGQEPNGQLYFALKVHRALTVLAKEHGLSYSATWNGIINSDTGQRGTLDDMARMAEEYGAKVRANRRS